MCLKRLGDTLQENMRLINKQRLSVYTCLAFVH